MQTSGSKAKFAVRRWWKGNGASALKYFYFCVVSDSSWLEFRAFVAIHSWKWRCMDSLTFWKMPGISRTATDIHATISISLSTGMSYTIFFTETQIKKVNGDKFDHRCGQDFAPPRPTHLSLKFLVKQSCSSFAYYLGAPSCRKYIWRGITTGTSLRKLGSTVLKNKKWFAPSKPDGSKYGLSKQPPIISIHTLTTKRFYAFLPLVPCGLSKAHRSELYLLKISSWMKQSSSVKRTRTVKFGSMLVFCMNQ